MILNLSPSVGHRTRYDEEGVFIKKCNVAHSLLVIGRAVMWLPFKQICNVTHYLLIIGQDVSFRICKVSYNLLVKLNKMYCQCSQ